MKTSAIQSIVQQNYLQMSPQMRESLKGELARNTDYVFAKGYAGLKKRAHRIKATIIMRRIFSGKLPTISDNAKRVHENGFGWPNIMFRT